MHALLATLCLTAALTTAGAVARSALHLEQEGHCVSWTCAACGVANTADPAGRFQATCRRCGLHSDWSCVETVARPDGFHIH